MALVLDGGVWRVQQAAAGGVTELAAWADRDLGADDGSEVYFNGVRYVFNATVGEYLRPFAAEMTCTLDAQITGTVLPSAETPAWTHHVTGSGAITTDGTYVRLNSESADADTAYVDYNHGSTGYNHFAVGYHRIGNLSSSGSSFQGISLFDGQYHILLDAAGVGLTGNPAAIRADSPSPYAEKGVRKTKVLTTETWVEIYTVRATYPVVSTNGGSGQYKGRVLVYFDHEEDPSIVASIGDLGTTAQTLYQLGDTSNTHRCSHYIRQFRAGRWGYSGAGVDALITLAQTTGAEGDVFMDTLTQAAYRKYTIPATGEIVVVPAQAYDGLVDLYDDGVGGYSYFNAAVDSIVTATARGWVFATGSGATITEPGGRYLLDTAGIGFASATVRFLPSVSPNKQLLMFKAEAFLTDGATNGVAFYCECDGRRIRTAWDNAGVGQYGSFVSPVSSTTIVGSGQVDTSGGAKWYFMTADSAGNVEWWSEDASTPASTNDYATVPYGTVTDAGVLFSGLQFWALNVNSQVQIYMDKAYWISRT